MTSSNLVTNEEVERACRSLGIKDWSTATGFIVSADEARAILNEIGGEAREVGLEDFREGLRIELEHGTRFPDANVTNNHPVLTGKIVLAHLKESLLYYKRLAVAELEGDLLKATKARDADQIRSVYGRYVNLYIAATMLRSQLCTVVTKKGAPAPNPMALGPAALYIVKLVKGSEGGTASRRRAGDSATVRKSVYASRYGASGVSRSPPVELSQSRLIIVVS